MSNYFEVGTVKLQVRSQHFYTNFVKDITPAEFLMLRYIHGPDAPALISIDGEAIEKRMNESGTWMKRPMKESVLREKLITKYKEKAVDKVFPGAANPLPRTFKEIGVVPGQGVDEAVSNDEDWTPLNESLLEDVDSKPRKKGAVDLLAG